MSRFLSFYRQWLSTGILMTAVESGLHSYLSAPVYYLLGLCCVCAKFFFLNPPFVPQTTLEFGISLPFPGVTAGDRQLFAEKWYSSQPRVYPFEGGAIQSRFVYQPRKDERDHGLMSESLHGMPFMSALCTYSDGVWIIEYPWWSPHIFSGSARVYDDHDTIRFVLKIEAWSLLVPLYRRVI